MLSRVALVLVYLGAVVVAGAVDSPFLVGGIVASPPAASDVLPGAVIFEEPLLFLFLGMFQKFFFRLFIFFLFSAAVYLFLILCSCYLPFLI